MGAKPRHPSRLCAKHRQNCGFSNPWARTAVGAQGPRDAQQPRRWKGGGGEWWSDGEDAHGVFAQTGDGPADEATGGLGGDAQVLAHLAEALALAIDQVVERYIPAA